MTDFAARRTMMVDTQVRPSDVTKFPIIDAMLHVPREEFVPANRREAAYMGENIDLDDGRVILEPRTLAKMLDVMDISRDELVLDVGCTYGYSSAVIARMAEAVIALEDDETLAQEAQGTLSDQHADNVMVHTGPLTDGAKEHAPFDAIMVQGGVMTIPDSLLDQLKDGGRVCAVFMDGPLGEVKIGYKIDGQISWRRAFNAGAPVLTGFEKQADFAL
jgi:protein-L-isoaspartate(D-aspartate) O-methyltransferase